MKFMKRNKGLLIFMAVVALLTYTLALRVEKLDSSKDQVSNNSLVINLW